MDLGLSDRVFVVTGGSRGLGRATAEVLVAEGAKVVLAARDADQLNAAVASLGPDRAFGVPTDLTVAGAEERLIAAAVARYGRIDGALLSCGGPPAGSVLETSDDVWRAAFESVFLGPLRTARALASTMNDGGAMAFVLSSSAREPIPGSRSPTACARAVRSRQGPRRRARAPGDPGQRADARPDQHRPHTRARCQGRTRRLRASSSGERDPAGTVRRPDRVRDGRGVRAVCSCVST